MARLIVDGADYEGAVLHTAIQHGLESTLKLCIEHRDNEGVREHFERSFWHLASMARRLYPPRKD